MSLDVGGRRSPAADFSSYILEIDATIHPVAAVHRACYALAACATFETERTDQGLRLRITARGGHRPDVIIDDFRRLLVDFTLRDEIESKTKGLRDLIWQTAFAEARRWGGS